MCVWCFFEEIRRTKVKASFHREKIGWWDPNFVSPASSIPAATAAPINKDQKMGMGFNVNWQAMKLWDFLIMMMTLENMV